MRKYPSDLTDRQWQVMQKILEDDRKREDPLHRVLDASLYVAKSGCQWRMLPKGHPCWQSVHHHFRKWERDGLVEHIHDALCRMVRQANDKSALPSVGTMDGQSAKRSALARQGCGYDGGKRTMGRKRHIVTDTLGPLLVVATHPANVHDSVGAKQVMAALRAKSLSAITKVFADGGYRGESLRGWVAHHCGWSAPVSHGPWRFFAGMISMRRSARRPIALAAP